ncbi:hypothetical protein BC830DRAFT_1100133 [Chytriomyces sp. MP71]|nr:hypothetical protein BC830DRAFT_1100133 [Chytriomyces sp. MP71]
MKAMTDEIDVSALANLDLGNDALNKAVTFVGTELAKVRKAKFDRERELAKVNVTDGDIELLVHELELSKSAAEKLLRENGGDVDLSLRTFISA